MTRKKLLGAAAIGTVLLAVVLISLSYSRFSSQQIYQESVGHLEEIYTQINSAFRSAITGSWRLLRSWRNYISYASEEQPEELAAFIQEEKSAWHFTSFYFLARDGSYITDLGGVGKLELEKNLDEQTGEYEEIVMTEDPAGAGWTTVFAVPISPGQYRGFDYAAIGISFDCDNLTKALSISAFSGQSDCFIISSDGRVLLSSREGGVRPGNLIDYLDSRGAFAKMEPETVTQDWAGGIQRVITCRLDGVPHYLCYQPMAISDWMLVSTAPVEIVNANMNHFAVVTLAVLALLFGLIAFGVVFFISRGSRRRMGKKNQEIRSRERLFDLLTENTEDIFVLFSPENFEAEYVSPNLNRVLGLEESYVRADVRRLLFAEPGRIFPEMQHEALTPEVLAAIPMGGTWTGDRDIPHAKTHELQWFKELLHRCSLEEQERFILMLSNRTQERQMCEMLGEALHTARAANEAKSNFLSNMSHDIRTPMNAIVGFSILLSKDAENPEKVREAARKISSSSQHLLSLINDILDMSKIESGKTSLNITQFSLPQMVDELYTMMLPQARAKHQNFELYTRGSLPELLLGDKLRLNQVLINLLSNAVKYTQDGGDITLTVQGLDQHTAGHSHLRFIVADNGFGMSEGFVQTIFDPFAREITEATREIQGTGLGMAITKNIIDLMGGTISVQSELERGSTFTVELELAVANPSQDYDFWRSHGITRLLVVDDEEDICLEVQNAMDGTGVDVSYATCGAAAVAAAAQAHIRGQAFHIILLDWKMPGMDGLEAARRIRQEVGTDVPILVLTSFDLESAREAGKDSGIDMFLPKPFFRSSFQRAVSQVLGEEHDAEAPAREEISLKGLNILAAEDNEINAEILLELLELEGVRCEIVSNGQEAVNRFLQSRPGEFDMIFMDVQMPVMDGYEATRAIRAASHPTAKTIPIIAMTANAFEEDIQTALAAGMNAHTAKPIDMDKLKATIALLRRPGRAAEPAAEKNAR